jgi:plastocyanin
MGGRRILLGIGAAAAFALAAAGPAGAAPVVRSYEAGPFELSNYKVGIAVTGNVPKPDVDGFITKMSTDVVDARTHKVVPIQRVMLHHIVFANLFAPGAGRPAQAFYGDGEERAKMELPPGYGYPTRAADRWALVWMLMNHRNRGDRVMIRYTLTIDSDPTLKPVVPVVLDASHGRQGLVYDVPGSGRPGSLDVRTARATAPATGRLVAGLGHVHGGAKDLVVTQPTCGNRVIYRSRPTWGLPSHPFYRVRPVLHEPGPIDMSRFASRQGIPVTAGQPLQLSSRYDASRPHTRVMGLLLMYLAPDPAVTDGCGPLPADVRTLKTATPGRAAAPRVTIPLTGFGPGGVGITVPGPPGPMRHAAGDAEVSVGSNFYAAGNLSVPAGATVTWRFGDRVLHNVTLASGPRGFSSDRLHNGGTYARRLTAPGTYKFFCELHPVGMVQRIVVRPPGT